MKSDINNKIIYSINVEDIQTVADSVLERNLSATEIKRIEQRLGSYIDWYGAIEMAIISLGIKQIQNSKQTT